MDKIVFYEFWLGVFLHRLLRFTLVSGFFFSSFCFDLLARALELDKNGKIYARIGQKE